MIEVLKMVKKDLANKNCKVNGETVKASSELTPPRKSFGKAQTMCYRVRAAAKGRETKLESSWGDDPDLPQCKNWVVGVQRTGRQVWVRRRRKVQSRLENVSRNHEAGFVQILSQSFLTRFWMIFDLPAEFDAFSLDTAQRNVAADVCNR